MSWIRIKAAFKNMIAWPIHHGGGTALMRAVARRPDAWRGYHVFCYHRIGEGKGPLFPGVPARDFEKHCAFLARHYRVLQLWDLMERSRRREPLSDAVAITFDDGYRDNLEAALPTLEKYQLPATIFLATSAIGTDEPLWHDRVAYILQQTKKSRLVLEAGGREMPFFLDSMGDRVDAVLSVCRVLKEIPEAEKSGVIEALRRKAGIPDYRGLAGDMLSWEDVKSMTHRRIAFGGHTVNHPILTRVSLEEAEREIVEGARKIEAETDLPCEVFAYPNGTPEDFSSEIEILLESKKFLGAVSRGFEANQPGGNPYDIRRWTPYPCTRSFLALKMEWMARGIPPRE